MTTAAFIANPGSGGATFAADLVAAEAMPISKIDVGAPGASSLVTAANPMPVVLTAAQITALAPLATQPVSATALPLPAGAATETTLAAFSAKFAPQGQALMATSSPVVIASNQSPIPTVEAATVIVGQAAQSNVINNILDAVASANATDVANLRAAVVQIISTGTAGSFIFEQSNDNANWRPLPVFNAETLNAAPISSAITATASQTIYTFPIRGRFIRLRISSVITGGSVQAFSRLSSDPWTPTVTLVASNNAGNLQATVSGTVTANVSNATFLPVTPTTTFTNSVAGTNATLIKNTAGTLWSVVVSNVAASSRFVKLFNLAVAPTVGTSVPVLTIALPAASTITINGGSNGIRFLTGIALSMTTGASDLDAVAVAAGDLKVATTFT